MTWQPDFSWVTDAIKAKGQTLLRLSERFGRSKNSATELVHGRRQLQLSELPILAETLGLTVNEVLAKAGLEEGERAAALLTQSGESPLLDRDLMLDVIRETKAWLDSRDEDLPPDSWADLVLVFYDLAVRDRARDPNAPIGPATLPSAVKMAR